MPASIEIRGIDRLQRRLGTLGRLHQELRPPMNDSLDLLWRDTRYTQSTPPKPPGSLYIRTYNLMDGWVRRIQNTMSGVVGRVFNDRTPHGPFVMSERFQAALHRGRWPTVEDIARDRRREIERIFQDAIDDIMRR